mgnify:CR=1 FL=1
MPNNPTSELSLTDLLRTADYLRRIHEDHKAKIVAEEALALKAAQEALADIARRRAIEIAKEGGAI